MHFLGEASNSKYNTFTALHNRSFLEAAQIPKWPPKVEGNTNEGANNYSEKCLFGYFNNPFHSSPNPEIIQKLFLTRWQVTAGLRITPIAHNKFLFELPSTQEAARVLAGDWFWDGRHLTLEWWSPESGSSPAENDTSSKRIKAFGIQLMGGQKTLFDTSKILAEALLT